MTQSKASSTRGAAQFSKGFFLSQYVRPTFAVAAALLGAAYTLPALAQVLSPNLEPSLTAINSGNITVIGDINNPTVNAGENNSITLTAEGAVIYFDSKSMLKSIAADPGKPVEAKANTWNVQNTGIVTTNGILAGTKPLTDNSGNVTVSAVGLQAGVMISTVPK